MTSSQPKKAPPRDPASKKRRRRRRRVRPKEPESAAQVLAEETKKIDIEKGADAPLSEEEVAALRQHFRFLHEHRKTLRLKVNAAEDLLLNGTQEPAHRGVCQHLLGKVDRGAVIAAVDRLQPSAAARLLGGIVRFSPSIEYILLFLEKVKLSSSQAEATAALSQGLQRIDFSEVTSAQMRRVLDLFTELFDDTQRPQLLFGLLESPSFRKAFDDSMEDMPEPLARLVVPLRAAQAAAATGKYGSFGADTLSRGIRLLLEAEDKFLLGFRPEVRRRLFDLGIQACHGPEHGLHRGLKILLGSFAKSERQHGELAMALVRHYLASKGDSHDDSNDGSNGEREARKLLKTLAAQHPDFHLPGRWLELLDAPRIDRFALLDELKAPQDTWKQPHRRKAICLRTMRPVLMQVAGREHADTHSATESLLEDVCIPNVAALLHSGRTPEGAAYYVVSDPGEELQRALTHKAGLALGNAVRACRDAAAIFSALASAGIQLPDARARRFALDPGGQLWLVDLSGGQQRPVGEAKLAHLQLVRDLCQHVLGCARRYIPPRDVLQVLEDASDCAELARALECLPALSLR